jgi:DNA-binding transcriptional LysR family regulator
MHLMIDWDDLRVFLAVCADGSVTAAARTLRVDKATVVRRVDRLEQNLGIRLLVRKASGWTPTVLGVRTAAAARSMSGALGALTSQLAGQPGVPRTTVTLTAPHWFCSELLLPASSELVREAPWIDLTIAATSRVLDLPQREADLAIRNVRPAHGELIVRRAGELGSAMYASRQLARRRADDGQDVDFTELRLVGYVDRVTYVPGFAWLEQAVGHARGITRLDDAQAICVALAAGLGVGVVPCFLGDRAKALARFGETVERETIWLVSPAELAGTRAVKVVSRFVLELFRRHADALRG